MYAAVYLIMSLFSFTSGEIVGVRVGDSDEGAEVSIGDLNEGVELAIGAVGTHPYNNNVINDERNIGVFFFIISFFRLT